MGTDDGKIFKISRDINQAKDLLEMAEERFKIVIPTIPRQTPYVILESYYELAVQLITALMYSEGFKTMSHISLVNYLKKFSEFSNQEINILDKMRKFRHGTVYYGRKESGNFFINHEKEIKKIIIKLFDLLKESLKWN